MGFGWLVSVTVSLAQLWDPSSILSSVCFGFVEDLPSEAGEET